jgi:hypothetical protein
MVVANELFSSRLREVVTAAGGQVAFAEASGVTQPQISAYCCGAYMPTAETAVRMAWAARVEVDWLLGMDHEKLARQRMQKRSSGLTVARREQSGANTVFNNSGVPPKAKGSSTAKATASSKTKNAAQRPSRASRSASKPEKLVCRYCRSEDLAPSFIKRRDARCRACFKKGYGSATRRKTKKAAGAQKSKAAK